VCEFKNPLEDLTFNELMFFIACFLWWSNLNDEERNNLNV